MPILLNLKKRSKTMKACDLVTCYTLFDLMVVVKHVCDM